MIFATFFFSIICSINMETVIKGFNVKDVLILTLICVIYIFTKYNVIQYDDSIMDAEKYQVGAVSGQNNQCIAGMGKLEYLPSKAYNNTFYIATREPEIVILQGDAQIEKQMKIGTYFTAKVSASENGTVLELPYIYYPGYTVRFDGIIVQTFETENGFLGCKISENDKGTIEVKYTGTQLINISKTVSFIAFVIYLIYVWKKH